MAEVGDIWFRMEDYTTSSYDPYGDNFGARVPRVRLSTYVIVRVTPKGVRLAMWFGDADRKLDEMEMLKLMAGGYITGPRRYVRDAATRRYAPLRLPHAGGGPDLLPGSEEEAVRHPGVADRQHSCQRPPRDGRKVRRVT